MSSVSPGFPTMNLADKKPSAGRAHSPGPGVSWFLVHLAQVAAWLVVYLGTVAGASLLRGLAESLRATESRFVGGIETVLKMYEDWFLWAPWALCVYALFGWISVWRAKPNGSGLRAWPYFLTFAFLLRRMSDWRRRLARGSYWKHSVTRHRWLLLVVKIHFLPLAVGSCINSFENICEMWRNVAALEETPALFRLCLAAGPLLVYLVDGLVATVAYSVESRRRGSGIRAVETNWLGWISCLVCYPPMLLITSSLLERRTRADDLLFSMTSAPLLVCAVLGLSFFVLYGFSALNLGLRYSNLTYRGTTTWGLFRAVRHPQYSSKLAGWLFEWLPFFAFWPNILCFFGWVAIYVTRAYTEERFLSRFEEYREYRQKVKWRFIPGIW